MIDSAIEIDSDIPIVYIYTLAITIVIVILIIILVYYRRRRFYSEIESWQDYYSAVRPPSVEPHKGEFLLNK